MLVMQLAPLRPLGAVAVCVSTVNAAVLGARPVLTGSLRCDEPGASLWPSPGWFPFLSPDTCVGPGPEMPVGGQALGGDSLRSGTRVRAVPAAGSAGT